MTSFAQSLRATLAEIRVAAHDQDLVEVPRQAMLDREAEHAKARLPLAFPEPVMVPGPK
jgi:hypothetical protein